MNIPYLLRILNTKKLSELIANIDLPPLDLNLILGDAENAGQIKVDRAKDKIKALTKPEITFDSDLASKLLRTMQQYEQREVNITRGRLNSLIKDPVTGVGYGYHEYLMALHYLIDSDQIQEEVVKVPKDGERPAHTFVFLQFAHNPNEDWNRNVVNKWVENWHKTK